MLTVGQQRVLRQLRSRHGRRKSPWFVVEGLRACAEAASRRPDWIEFAVISAAAADAAQAVAASLSCSVIQVAPEAFQPLSMTETPQGIMLIARRPADTPPAPVVDPLVLALDGLRDPGNVGTILRCAWAAGLTHAAVTYGTADAYGAKAVRAGMGAQFALQVSRFSDLAALLAHFSAQGFRRVWRTTLGGGASCFGADFDPRGGVIIFGSEAHGLDPAAPGDAMHIPMPGGADSLNVAQAATVVLFDAVRRGLFDG